MCPRASDGAGPNACARSNQYPTAGLYVTRCLPLETANIDGHRLTVGCVVRYKRTSRVVPARWYLKHNAFCFNVNRDLRRRQKRAER